MTRTRRPSAQTIAVLSALADEPTTWRYGYELGKQLDLRPGSLYPILVRLAGNTRSPPPDLMLWLLVPFGTPALLRLFVSRLLIQVLHRAFARLSPHTILYGQCVYAGSEAPSRLNAITHALATCDSR